MGCIVFMSLSLLIFILYNQVHPVYLLSPSAFKKFFVPFLGSVRGGWVVESSVTSANSWISDKVEGFVVGVVDMYVLRIMLCVWEYKYKYKANVS